MQMSVSLLVETCRLLLNDHLYAPWERSSNKIVICFYITANARVMISVL